MDSPFKGVAAAAGELLRPLAGHAASARQTAHITDSREWREGYRRHLITRSGPPHQAADMAAKVAFRPDLYPLGHGAPLQPPVQPASIITVRQPADATVAYPKRSGKLLDAGHEIATTPPTGNDMAFTHAVLCQVGLPRSKVEGREFHRQSGDMWINVQAGWLDEGRGPVAQPVPYGAMPRLALAMISTLAKRHKTREIPIGESAAQFLKLMGMDDQKNRYVKLREQMHALAACRLQSGPRLRTPCSTRFRRWCAPWYALNSRRFVGSSPTSSRPTWTVPSCSRPSQQGSPASPTCIKPRGQREGAGDNLTPSSSLATARDTASKARSQPSSM